MRPTDPLELLRAASARTERGGRAGEGPDDGSRTPAATLLAAVTDADTDLDAGPVPSALDSLAATGARSDRRRRSPTRNAIEWVLVLVGALAVALVVKTFLFQAFYIPSGSMEPALAVGDRVLVNKVSYDLEDVEQGDIIVFERPDTWGVGAIDDLIKRVIALPGQTVSVRDGVVYIDGAPLEEPYLPDGVVTPPFLPESGCVPECTIAEGQLFVLGDNRGNSDASNHFGSLPFDEVVGRAFIRVWPFTSFGGL